MAQWPSPWSTGRIPLVPFQKWQVRQGRLLKYVRVGLTWCCVWPQVSDREWLATQPSTTAHLAQAAEMLAAGQGEEVCFCAHDIDGAAITARRWQALAGLGGDDDYFSSDLTDVQLKVGWQTPASCRWLGPAMAMLAVTFPRRFCNPQVVLFWKGVSFSQAGIRGWGGGGGGGEALQRILRLGLNGFARIACKACRARQHLYLCNRACRNTAWPEI